MKALLENADLFAHKINFNFKKKNLYHSFFGIGLSFAFYGVMAYFVYYFSNDFVNGINPRVIYRETEFEDNITIQLQNLIEPRIYFSALLFPFNNTNITEFEFVNKTRILPEKLGKLYIINWSREGRIKQSMHFNYTITVQAQNKDKMREKFYNFTGYVNENSTYFTTTYDEEYIATEEDIDTYHECPSKKKNFTQMKSNVENGDDIVLEFVPSNFSDTLINSLNFSFEFDTKNFIINANSHEFLKPYIIHKTSKPDCHRRFRNETIKCNNEYDETFTSIIGLNSDRGFIFSEFEKKYALKQNSLTKPIKETKNKVILYSVKIDSLIKTYDRVYKKLQNVFADLGGILSSFILIGNILIVQFNKKKFDYDMINKVFKIEKEIDGGEFEMRARRNNPGINPNDNSENVGILEMDSSRNFMKNSINIEILNNDQNMEIQNNNQNNENNNENKFYSDSNLDETHNRMKPNDISSVKFEPVNLEPKNSDKENNYDNNDNNNNLINIDSINVNNYKNEPAQENEFNLNQIDSFVRDFGNGRIFKKPLKYTKKDFLKSFLCCNKLKGRVLIKKEKIFNLAQDQIYEYLDVVNFVQLFEKIENLISIIFNEHQALSFNFIKSRQVKEIKNKSIDRDGIKKVIEYYRENINQSSMSLMDERLVKRFYSSFSKMI